MNTKNRRLLSLLAAALAISCGLVTAGDAAAEDSGYFSASVAGKSTNYVTIDMNSGVYADMMIANGNVTSTQSVAAMAQANGAFAAINGTYFEAYEGLPIAWGTVIRDGEMVHSGNNAVGAFTADGRFLVDRITWEIEGYLDGELVCYPWRINHPSTEAESISILTDEYQAPAVPPEGGKAILVGADGRVSGSTEGEFTVPAGGFVMTFGPAPQILAQANKFYVGGRVSYSYSAKTTFTGEGDWKNITCAVGAGPSLIINGQVTADGPAEGFTEDKIVTYAAGRSFIGATADNRVFFGNIGAATLTEAAAVCQELGLVNAMCLDGGGSIALYYEGRVASGGRDVNNALGFFRGEKQPPLGVSINGRAVNWTDARPFIDENSRTLVPLRAVADAMGLEISWDGGKQEAKFTDGERSIIFPVGSRSALTTEGSVTMDTAAIVIEGRTYAPARPLAVYFGYEVTWDGATRTVILTKEGDGPIGGDGL